MRSATSTRHSRIVLDLGRPARIVILYSHAEERWKIRLEPHLRVLEKQGLVNVWSDRSLPAGAPWDNDIRRAIDDAEVVVALVSASFLSSEYITGVEIRRILKRHGRGELQIVPVLVRDCPWQRVPWLKGLRLRPASGKPLEALRSYQKDTALAEIAKEIAGLGGPKGRPSSAQGSALG